LATVNGSIIYVQQMFEHVFTLLQRWQQHCTLLPDTRRTELHLNMGLHELSTSLGSHSRTWN